MADVKKIKLPDNSVYNIKDYRIPGVDTVPTSGSGNVITSGGIYAANYAGSDSNGGPALKTYGIPYGAVDSASTATVITATVDNFPTELTDGVCAYIRNDIISSASGWTLNVNGTGAKPVYASNADASRVTTLFSAASTFLFVYNSTRVSGGCWDMYYGYNANDNTIGYNLRTNGTIAPTKSKFYRYRILFTSPDGQYLIPSNTSTSTNATAIRSVNQDKIDPFGPIYYYNSTTAIEANASVGASYLWLQYSAISLGYSFNRTSTALTLTAKHPIYIKCAPQTDGSAIIDDGTPFVQTLPSTEDGKIYIFLGYAESATAVTLYYWHPVYYYKDNAIRLWTNAADTTITVDTELDLESENPISNGAVTQVIFDNEQVTAAALNNLNGRMLEAEGTLSEMDDYISDLGEVTSAALNDLNDRALDLEDAIQNVNLEEMTSVTWEELVTLRNNNELKPGHQYRITDYVTKVRWRGGKSAEHPFDIIVTADSTNRLSEIARAILPSNDNYFSDYSKWPEYTPLLRQWELKYCLDNDVNRFTWAEPGVQYITIDCNDNAELLAVRNSNYDDNIGSGYYGWEVFTDHSGNSHFMFTLSSSPSTGDLVWDEYQQQIGTVASFNTPDPGKGVIYYMKDEFNNSAYYDFKNVMFERKYDSHTEGYSTMYSPEYGSSMSIYCYTFNCLMNDDNGGHVSEDGTLFCNGNSYYIDGGYNGVRNSKIEPYYEQSVYSPGGGNGGPILQGQGILTLPNIVVWSTWFDGTNIPSMNNLFIDSLAWNLPTYNLQKTITTDTENKIYSERFMATQNLQYNYINKDATHSQLTSALNIYNAIHPGVSTYSSSTSSYSISSNVLTTISGTITGRKTFTLSAPADSNIENHYFWTFDTGATVPTITWPSGLTWPEGSAPTLKPNHHYEFSILNNVVAWMEV